MTNMRMQYLVDGAPVQVRVHGDGPGRDTGARWNDKRGWPVAIAHTRTTAYVSGSYALNLPAEHDNDNRGDWHEPWTWWTPTYLGPDDAPYKAELWGPDGDVMATPGPAQLRDARRNLAQIEHPDAQRPEPVHAATVAQAVIDLAWRALAEGQEPPDRRATYQWLSDAGDAEALQIARAVAIHIDNTAVRKRWLAWATSALEGEDPFYSEPPSLQLQSDPRLTKVNTVMVWKQ